MEGIGHMERHPNTWGVFKHKDGPLHPLSHEDTLRTYRCTEEHWGHMQVFEHMGHWGGQNMGASNVWGHTDDPHV